MLNKYLHWLDIFLPSHLGDQVNMAVLFRARSIVGAGLLGAFVAFFIFLGVSYLGVPLYLRIIIFFSLIVIVSFLVFIKTRTSDFDRSLNVGAGIQMLIFYMLVYATSFAPAGMGFFGLIWLIPLFLLTATYFRPMTGAICVLLNILLLTFLYFKFEDSFFLPLDSSHFKSLYLLNLFLSLLSSYFLSYLFMQLNRRLKEDLTKQKDQLQENAKFQALGQMASGLAHDINNPLFTIQGKLHQIRNLFSQNQLDLDKCDAIIEEVESTILRLSQIVKSVSTFARQGRDQMVSVSADELVRGIVFLCSDRIVQAGITFDIKIAPNTTVICHPPYISTVLGNLLNNAIDALENAEVKLIVLEVFTRDNWVEMHVKDSGPGVAADVESKIFDTFYSTKKHGKGSGQGLSIARSLVEIHEGDLKYQRSGNMTDFVLRLPSYE